MPEEIKSFEEFWPFYVAEHSQPRTRALHFAGTAVALATATGEVSVTTGWTGCTGWTG